MPVPMLMSDDVVVGGEQDEAMDAPAMGTGEGEVAGDVEVDDAMEIGMAVGPDEGNGTAEHEVALARCGKENDLATAQR